MQTAKGRGGSVSHRYQPAAEYDDATLAQKREYWRTKKREQRARLSKHREEPAQGIRGKTPVQSPNAPTVVNSSLSGPFATFSSPLQSNDELHRTGNILPASQSGNRVAGGGSVAATDDRKEKWLQTMKLNKVSPRSQASCAISTEAAGVDAAEIKCLTSRGAAGRAVTSPTRSGTQPNASSSVPPARVTRITNGSSTKTAPQPCVSMQGASVPKTQHKAQVASCIQPKLLPANVTTGVILASFPRAPISVKKECQTANATPQGGTKSALVTSQRASGAGGSQPSTVSEEERAARRREHWRIKKREQRAKVAARIARVKERASGPEVVAAPRTGPVGGSTTAAALQHLPSRPLLRRVGHRQCSARANTSSVERKNDELGSGSASLATVHLHADQIKVQNLHGNKTSQTAVTSGLISTRRAGEPQRKLPNYVHLFNVSRGIARFKTPRQRFIEAQKNFVNQRNIRCKSTLLASVFGTRNIPKIDPNDTPEQIIAKRREYWRVKKREQRAKLSMEVKARLKEKDSLTRRVKRYQKILEEMRRARALTQQPGDALAHASETIGGFIKEDGTVTVNLPQVTASCSQAASESEREAHGVSDGAPITEPQRPDGARGGTTPVRVNPPALRPALVKVSFPLAGRSANKPPRLLSIRPRSQLESATAGQLTLTHPQTPESAVSRVASGGCIMKMEVSSGAPAVAACIPDPKLTEEERMAKKREYWRIKKREQRAARATRLKGALQARTNAALQRRKTQKQVAAMPAPPSGRFMAHSQTLPNDDDGAPVASHASGIKQESELMPAADPNSQPKQATCADIKPPTSPTPPPAPQPEPDLALNGDSQATTLLAVASMKKLLEESLSTVTECKSERADVKVEPTEETEEKPDLAQLFFEKDEVAPIAANLTLEIKSWQPDADAFAQTGSQSPRLKGPSQISEALSTRPASDETVQHPTCEHSSQTPSNFIVNPSVEASDGPSSPRRAQRLRIKSAGRQSCCSPEPPKLYHLPMAQPQPQQQQHSGPSSLQKKREYWKLMKRQQRARVKARQEGRRGECSRRLSEGDVQAPGLGVINAVKGVSSPAKPALQPRPSIASLTSIPAVLSPTKCNADRSPETLRIKLPANSVSCSPGDEQNSVNGEPSRIGTICLGALGIPQQAMQGPRRCVSTSSSDGDPAPSLPTLKPPDNPLSSMNLQPIELPGHTPNSSLSPMQIPCAQLQNMIQPPAKLAPISTMVPPKPIPGESEEDFLKRKREYWRIKKKEQRARKAIRDKGTMPRRASSNWRPILPAQDLQAQDSGQWVSSSEESEHLMSAPVDANPDPFAYSDYAAPIEDESDLLFAPYEANHDEEGPVQDAVWRSRYLMDYDPLNQLLVCMVCGELQYSHSLEGVRAHIDEAHPDTLTLEPGEQRRILEAWDEQVSRRERFFTNQLQQHSGALAEAHGS